MIRRSNHDADQVATISIDISTDRNASMKMRCPVCASSLSIEENADWSCLHCTSCGSTFSLLPDTATKVWTSGNTFAHFNLLRPIGSGSFGTVWAADDVLLRRQVAIKIPHRPKLSVPEAEQVLREARAVARLHHPNIVTLHEVGRYNEVIYLVSEFVPGQSLGDWIQSRAIPPRKTAEIFQQIATGLAHAHAAGIVHRDLKPENIVINEQGVPKLLDFGLAKSKSSDATTTIKGQIIGTPAYMSPEQARGEGYLADERCDIFSCGVILFRMLTGKLPFRGNSLAVIERITSVEAPDIRTLNAELPADMAAICAKCLEKDPQRRFQSAAELAREFERYLSGQPIVSRSISRTECWARWADRNPLVAATAIATAFVIFVGAAMVVATNGHSKRLIAEQVGRTQHEFTRAAGERSTDRVRDLQALTKSFLSASVVASMSRMETFDNPPSTSKNIAQFTANGKFVARLEPTSVCMFELETGFTKRIAAPNDQRIDRFAMSRNGELLAIVLANQVLIYETHAITRTAQIVHDKPIMQIAFSPNRERIAMTDSDGAILIWETTSGKRIETDKAFATYKATAFGFSPDSTRLYSAKFRSINFWNLVNNHAIQVSFRVKHGSTIERIAISPTGDLMLACSNDRLEVWDNPLKTSNPIGHHTAPMTCTAFAFSSDGSEIVVVDRDRILRLLTASNLAERASIQLPDAANAITYQPDYALIATSNGDIQRVDVKID